MLLVLGEQPVSACQMGRMVQWNTGRKSMKMVGFHLFRTGENKIKQEEGQDCLQGEPLIF